MRNDSFNYRKSELGIISACFGGFSVIMVLVIIGMIRCAFIKQKEKVAGFQLTASTFKDFKMKISIWSLRAAITNLVFLIGVYICLTVSFLAGQNYQQNHVKVNAKEDYEYDILERIIIVLVAVSNSIVFPILFA